MRLDTERDPAPAPDEPGAGPPPRRLLAVECIEDYAVASAVAIRRPDVFPWLPLLRPVGSPLPALPFPTDDVHEHLGPDGGIDTAEWTAFQRLWHRWLAPMDRLPAMRWFLTAAWPDREPPPGALAEHVDDRLQDLALRRPAERAALLEATLGAGDAGRPVLGWGDPEWALPAMLHARLGGRQFVWFDEPAELLEAVAGTAGAPLVVVPPHELDLDLANALQEARTFRVDLPRLRDVAFQSRPLGFFTARTLETLTRMVVKQDAYRRRPVGRSAWVFTGEVRDRATDPDVQLLGRDQAAAAYVELLEDPEVLVLSGHSREDLFHLGEDAICGRSPEVEDRTPADDRLPACALDGRCVKAGTLLPAHRLTARALLMNGCNLMRLGGRGTFAPEYTIAFTALEGACNLVVASRRTRFGEAYEQVLLHQLLRAGTPVGEAVRIVNNSLPLSGDETPDNVVLGDPSWRLYPDQGAGAAEVDLLPTEDGWRLRAAGVDTPVLRVALPGLPSEVHVRFPDGEDGPDDLLYSVAPEPDGGAALLIFGWRRLVADRLDLEIGCAPPAGDAVAALGRAHRNLVYGRLLRGCLPKFDNQERELRSLGVHVARRLREARHRVRAAGDALQKAAEAEELLDRMDAGICAALLDRIGAGAFVWLEQYLDVDGSFDVAEQLPAGTRCPYCRSPLVRRVYRHRFQPGAARDFEICQTCGNVWDLPLDGLRPRFDGPDVLVRGTRVPQGVALANPSEHRVRGRLGFRVYQADGFGVRVTPPHVAVELPPGAERVVPFEIEVGDRIPAHMEFMRGFWVSALDVAVFQKNVWVVPSAGRGAAARDGEGEGR